MDSAPPHPDQSAAEPLIPLRAVNKTSGEVYYRRTDTIEAIRAASQLPRDTLIQRAAGRIATAPGYISSEALVYFLRRAKKENSETHFERLYEVLIQRVSALCGVYSPHDDVDLKTADLQDKVLDKFIDIVARDRKDYETRLDYFEVNFNHAIALLRLTGKRSINRKQGRTVSIDQSFAPGEMDLRIEAALQAGDPSRMTPEQKNLFRISILPAISKLPEKEQEVLKLMMQGFQSGSDKSGAPTIAEILGCSTRTVNNRYNSAVENLKRILKVGDPS